MVYLLVLVQIKWSDSTQVHDLVDFWCLQTRVLPRRFRLYICGPCEAAGCIYAVHVKLQAVFIRLSSW